MTKLLQFPFKEILKTASLIISIIIIIIAAIADLYRPIIYQGNVLPGQIGRIEGRSRIAEEGKDKEGFLTYGPYAHLEPGKYKIKLEYSASSAESGSWDIIYTREPHWIIGEKLPLRENGLISHSITVLKEDIGKTLEIRTKYSGRGTLKVSKIVIKKRIATNAILIRALIGGIIAFLFYLVSVRFMPLIIGYLNLGLNSVILFLRSVTAHILSPLLSGLTRESKIRYLSTIVLIGFILSLVFHYFIRLGYYHLEYPFTSFLHHPINIFCDFYSVFDVWARFKFNSTFNQMYFPFTYLIIDLFTKLKSPYNAVIIHSLLFSAFFVIYAYQNLSLTIKTESFKNVVICSFMSYPFIFTLHTGNIEAYVFVFLALFIITYHKTRFSTLFLAMAISMKLFPAVFLILLISDKKYKEIIYTLFGVIIFTMVPLLFFDGGFNKGIGNYLTNFIANLKWYSQMMVIDGVGNIFGHSLLTVIRIIFAPIMPPIQSILKPYLLFAFISFGVITAWIVFKEKIFWKKVALLVLSMNLLPYVSTDYKLMHLFIPLFLFINYQERDKWDFVYTSFFSLLLIPKNYFSPFSFSAVLNPIIMLFILLLIIMSKKEGEAR